MLFYHCGYRSVASPLGVSLLVCISCLSVLVYCCVSRSVACFSAVFVYRSAVSQCWSIIVSIGLLPVLRLYSCIDQLCLSVGLLLCLSVCCLFFGCIRVSISCVSMLVYCCVCRSVACFSAVFVYRSAVSQCWSIVVSIGLLPVFRLYSCIDQLCLNVGLLLCLSVCCMFFGCIRVSISCVSMLVYCCVCRSVACFSTVFVYRSAVSQCWSIVVSISLLLILWPFSFIDTRSAVSQCWSIVVSLGLSPILWLYSFIDQLSLSLLLCLSVCFLFSGPIHLSIRNQLSSLSMLVCYCQSVCFLFSGCIHLSVSCLSVLA